MVIGNVFIKLMFHPFLEAIQRYHIIICNMKGLERLIQKVIKSSGCFSKGPMYNLEFASGR